jgi:UDP-glucose 4-epimerase
VKGFTLKNSKVLVVGGAGFVGSNLVLKLIDAEVQEIFIVDNLLSSISANIPIHNKINFIFGSIANQRTLNQIPRDIDFVWHLACYHGNQSSIADPIADHDNNSLTSLMLFEHISKFTNLKKVVYSAAGCAVAEKTHDNAKPTLEDAPITLFHDSPYSISKIIGEMYGNYYYTRQGLPFVRARFQNVYGPREILGAGKWRGTSATIWRNVIPTFIWLAIEQSPLKIEGSGQGTRDFIYVEDVCEGLIKCALNGIPGEAYNLASGVQTKIIELAELIIQLSKSKSKIIEIPRRSWDSSGQRFGSTIKSKDFLSFETKTSLVNGLENTINWTKSNHQMINNNIKSHNYFLID